MRGAPGARPRSRWPTARHRPRKRAASIRTTAPAASIAARTGNAFASAERRARPGAGSSAALACVPAARAEVARGIPAREAVHVGDAQPDGVVERQILHRALHVPALRVAVLGLPELLRVVLIELRLPEPG